MTSNLKELEVYTRWPFYNKSPDKKPVMVAGYNPGNWSILSGQNVQNYLTQSPLIGFWCSNINGPIL